LIFVALTNLECGFQAEAAEKQKIASTSATEQSQPKSGVKLSKEVSTDYLLAENINNVILLFEQSRHSYLFCPRRFLFTLFSVTKMHESCWFLKNVFYFPFY
jgi:hypothetical protein